VSLQQKSYFLQASAQKTKITQSVARFCDFNFAILLIYSATAFVFRSKIRDHSRRRYDINDEQALRNQFPFHESITGGKNADDPERIGS
jgi:hypothetical protein